MGVYISNMSKPKNAFECSTKINPEERMCIYTGKVFEETLSLLLDRPCDDCPIIEIPTPHGRIIDEDEIYEQPHCGECNDATLDAINNAPTILEAEEE